MKDQYRQKLLLVEDHHQAYYAWKKQHLFHQTLIHIDAHLDYEAVDHNKIDIGNFLFFAIKNKIVTKIYWVIPGSEKSFCEDLIFIKKNFLKIHKSSLINRFVLTNGIIKTDINTIPLYISTLDTLPIISEPVLLDIDVDFFLFNSLKNNNPLNNIGKRKPWITTKKFVRIINKKIIKRNFITISYSVNGGYTPIIYKTIGDDIAAKFGYLDTNLNKRLQAGKSYLKFRKFFDQGKIDEAKKYYKLAVFLNRKYLVRDNNYGTLFLLKKDFNNAEKEFLLMLRINPFDIHCLVGLGIISIYKTNLIKAKNYFKRALSIDKKNKTVLLYLAYIELKLKNYSLSKKYVALINKYYKKGMNKIFILFILSRLYGIEKQFNLMEKNCRAILKYKIDGDLHIPLGLELLF